MILNEQEQKIYNTETVVMIMRNILKSEHETDQGREHFWVIGMNTINVVQYIELVSLGTESDVFAHPKEVFRFAVMKGIASIILCHNHPSGDTYPSEKDINITRRLRKSGEILGIEVMDHVIIGKSALGFSFRDKARSAPLFKSVMFDEDESQRQTVPKTTPVSLGRKIGTKTKEEDEWVVPPTFDMRDPNLLKHCEAIAARQQNLKVIPGISHC